MIAKSAEGLVRRVNILADKALLAAFSQNVYEVTPKHVSAAIKDSEFGAEQLKRALKKRTMTAIGAMLVIGLALTYLVYAWLPNVSTPADASLHSAAASGVKAVVKPVEAAVPDSAQLPVTAITEFPVALTAIKDEVAIDAEHPTPLIQPATARSAELPTPVAIVAKENEPTKLAVAQLIPATQSATIQAAVTSTTPNVSKAPLPETSAVSPQADTVVNADASELMNSADILQARLNETQLWLKQQPASTVTIQLFGSANDDQLKRQLTALVSQLELRAVYPFRTQVNGKPFVSVLYGSFANKQEALQAVAKLPASLKSYQPHLRTVGGILKETNQFQ